MYKVTITLNNEHRISNVVPYCWADDICENLNKARRDAFVPVAGMLVQPEDVSSITIEEIEGARNAVGCADNTSRSCGSDCNSDSDSYIGE